MELWEIIVPTRTNDGASYADALRTFEAYLLDTFGGFTVSDVRGGWKDLETARIYVERNRAYRVLVAENGGGPATAILFRTFPDQLAFFVAHIGTGQIVSR